MTLSMKLGGAWKEAQSLHVKINGEWKDVSTLYSKKDGAWVTVYSSGALIEFADYPYPIPVAAGWKYSVDKVNWTKVEADGELNSDGGMFTGFVKANKITLSEYYTEYIPEDLNHRIDGTPTSIKHSSLLSSFVNGGKGYVCGGGGSSNPKANVDVYDEFGNRTDGTPMSVERYEHTSFVNGGKGYVCGGKSWTEYYSTVDVYDTSGNRTTGTSLSVARTLLSSFVIGGKGYVCGGQRYESGCVPYSTVDVYNSSGTRTTGTSLSVARFSSTTFLVNGIYENVAYICGGEDKNYDSLFAFDMYHESGTRTSGTMVLDVKEATAFSLGSAGYLCGGYSDSDAAGTTPTNGYMPTVTRFDEYGIIGTISPLSVGRYGGTAFSNNSKGYVCGGGKSGAYTTVDIYDISDIRTTGTDMAVSRRYATSFVNNSRGYICGGNQNSNAVDVYYDQKESYITKIPITEGSTYTLNGESGTAEVSKVMKFDNKVSGTINYKKGTVPSS